ncbi:hypothetical protein C4J81_00710 [Deltaproteobacteria bacterium Smac51]|nr:hypothetical protein C4J81_00710 [Deltaproteobacteria bacterium Smac51]
MGNDMYVGLYELKQLDKPDDQVPAQRKFDICMAFDSKFAECKQSVDPLELICMYVCCCNEFPTNKNSEGDLLKQVCVNFNMARNNDTEKAGLTISPMYNMNAHPYPRQIFKRDGSAPASNIFEAVRLVSKLAVGAGGEMIEEYTKGAIRVPDFARSYNPHLPPEGINLDKIYEVKFPGDKWGDGQKEAYETILNGRKEALIKVIPDKATDKSGLERRRTLEEYEGMSVQEIMAEDDKNRENVHSCECAEKSDRRKEAAAQPYPVDVNEHGLGKQPQGFSPPLTLPGPAGIPMPVPVP